MSDGNNLLHLISYSIQKPSCGSLTPYIKMCTTIHKITQAWQYSKFVFMPKIRTHMPNFNILACLKAEI